MRLENSLIADYVLLAPGCVAFGELIMPEGDASNKDDVAALTEAVRNSVAALLEEYGGEDR